MIFYARIEGMQFVEKHLSVVVYRGDTLENFQTCFIKGKEGRTFFDRRKEPRYAYEETHVSRRGAADAFSFALRNARELGHTPIIISGRLPVLSRYMLASLTTGMHVILPPEVSFPVDRIWLPREDFNWRELNLGGLPSWTLDHSEILNRFELFDPNSLIDK